MNLPLKTLLIGLLISSVAVAQNSEQKIHLQTFEVNNNIAFQTFYYSSSDFEKGSLGEKEKLEVGYTDMYSPASIERDWYDAIDSLNQYITVKDVNKKSLFAKVEIDSVRMLQSNGLDKWKRIGVHYNLVVNNYRNQELLDYEGWIFKTQIKAEEDAKEINKEYSEYWNFNVLQFGLIMPVVDEITSMVSQIDWKEQAVETTEISTAGGTEKAGEFSKALGRSVLVKGSSETISGFVLDDHYLITDSRIFVKEGNRYAFINADDSVKITPITMDQSLYLVLAKFEQPLSTFSTFPKFAEESPILEELYSFGNPYDIKWMNTFSKGNIAGKDGATPILDGFSHLGFSGSAVYNFDNEILGIVIAEGYDDASNIVMRCVPIEKCFETLHISRQTP